MCLTKDKYLPPGGCLSCLCRISMEKIMCAKCGTFEVEYEGAYCDKCKGTFDDRCNKFRTAMNSVEETGDWRKDWESRKNAINSMFR